MKKYIYLAFLLLLVVGCSTTDDSPNYHTYIGRNLGEEPQYYKVDVSPLFEKVPGYTFMHDVRPVPNQYRFQHIPEDIEYEYRGRNREGELQQMAILDIYTTTQDLHGEVYSIEHWKTTSVDLNDYENRPYEVFEREESKLELSPFAVMIKTEKNQYDEYELLGKIDNDYTNRK